MAVYNDEEFEATLLPASEEIKLINRALKTAKDIEKDLEDCYDTLNRLSAFKTEETSYLYQISPENSWKGAEYLSYVIESVINEELQNASQKTFTVAETEIDLDSGIASPLSSMEFINQITVASSRINIDDSDNKKVSCEPESQKVDKYIEKDFLNRHCRLSVKKIKVKRGVESALFSVQKNKYSSPCPIVKTTSLTSSKISTKPIWQKRESVLTRKALDFQCR